MEDSEGDSEASGNENEGDFCEKFSQKILGAPAEATLVSHGSKQHQESSSDDDEPLVKYVPKSKKFKSKSKLENWYQQDLPDSVNLNNVIESDTYNNLVSKENPIQFFELFWTDAFFENIKEQTT
ncbi:unnamed protein product [Acanthoscelides obtectus]|uniref:Uncharacterized protein n=1 Tax=Acanthoscelides obtectus TaxID=200917 RepID=A0A9P0K909_ACAOB|nr:unnamed protein product [Acanthoscelides obtectus]CAK1662332.1 hypothetical protein AOBTE_LOCUS23085 [Acanthoscelides obtectus]